MVCPNCGKENLKKAKFCENCGTPLRKTAGASPVRVIQLRCRSCDGIMTSDPENKVLTCPYCGSKELIVETEAVTLEKLRIRSAAEKAARAEREKSRTDFEKSAMRRVLIVFAIVDLIFAAASFISRYAVSGIIAVVQSILNLTAWLIGMQIIKSSRRHLPRALMLTGIILIIPYFVFFGIEDNIMPTRNITREWEDSVLTSMLEKPPVEKGYIYTSSDSAFSMDLTDVTPAQYRAYVTSCKEKGFTEDSMRDDNSYTAFHESGTKLELNYYEYMEEMSIRLSAPLELNELYWPTSKIAALLPQPASRTGLLNRENETSLSIYVGETSRKAYNEYVQQCLDAGFDADYYRNDTSFSGNTEDGYRLMLDYYGFNIMEINLYAPQKSAE